MDREKWRTVACNDRYEVSDNGRVRRKDGDFIKPRLSNTGYWLVGLSRDRVRQYPTVHSLVCAAFHGPRPSGMFVNHKNGVKTDNHYSNLEWTTPAQNAWHAIRLGLTKRPPPPAKGAACLTSKLTQAQVDEIRANACRLTGQKMATLYGVSPAAISAILRGETWADSYNADSRPLPKRSSRFRGVSHIPDTARWKARIGIDGKDVTIGIFATEEDAALAYDEIASERFGDKAKLNFPRTDKAAARAEKAAGKAMPPRKSLFWTPGHSTGEGT